MPTTKKMKTYKTYEKPYICVEALATAPLLDMIIGTKEVDEGYGKERFDAQDHRNKDNHQWNSMW